VQSVMYVAFRRVTIIVSGGFNTEDQGVIFYPKTQGSYDGLHMVGGKELVQQVGAILLYSLA